MLYTADSGIFTLGMLICCFFGNSTRFCQPSVDLFLFLGTAMVSKHIESLPEPHEHKFDAHILSLAGLYFVAGDKLRVSLLGVWLPYFYIDTDRGKCGAYISLAAAVPMFPHLRRAYQVVWPSVSTLLCNSFNVALSRLCIYAIKAIESVTPCLAPPSHLPPPPPTLSLSAVITTAKIAPLEEPKAAMVDSSAQAEALAKTDSSTQWEENWVVKPVCSPKTATRYVVMGNGIISTPLDVEKPSIKRHEPSGIRKHRLRGPAHRGWTTKVPTPFPSPPASPPDLPIKPVTSVGFAPVSRPTPPIKSIMSVRLADVSRPTPPIKPIKSVRFADVPSPASPTPLSGSSALSSLAVVDQNPVSPSFSPSSRSVLASASTSPDVSAVPALVPALASPDPTPELTPAPVAASAQTSVPESSTLAVECAPVSTPASCVTTQPTPSLSTVSPPSSVPSPILVSDHLSPALAASPSPISATVSLQVSPVLRPSPTPVSAPTPGVLSPLLPSPVISPAVAVVPVSGPEFEQKSNVELESISFSPVLPADSALSTTSHPDALIVAPVDQMEMDSESIDQASVPLPVDDLGDIQMGEAIREEARTAADFGLYLDDSGIEADVGLSPDPEFVLTNEDIDILFNDALAATCSASPEFNAPPTNKEVENFLGNEAVDIPLIEDFPLVRDFFVPAMNQWMQDVAPDNAPAANRFNDGMMVDAACVPAPESPEFVMSVGEEVEEIEDEEWDDPILSAAPIMFWNYSTTDSSVAIDEDDQMDVDETDEMAATGHISGPMPSTPLVHQEFGPGWPAVSSTLIDADSRMDENADAFDMSGLLSSLPPTPVASPAQTSTAAPSTPNSAVDDGMGNSPNVYGCLHTLFRSPSTVPSPNSKPLVPTSDNADIEDHFELGSTGFVSGSGLTGASASVAGSAAVPVSLAMPSTLISAGPVSGDAVASPAMSPAPAIPVSPARPVLEVVSISKRLPPRPSPAEPPIEFISK